MNCQLSSLREELQKTSFETVLLNQLLDINLDISCRASFHQLSQTKTKLEKQNTCL